MKIKIIALFILIAMLMPLSLACGEDPADTGPAAAGDSGEPAGEEPPPEQAPDPTPAPTPEPPPTDPPTTEAPTEPFAVDESLAYWDQIYSELEWRGMSGGVAVFRGDDELDLMRRFGRENVTREELDVSGDGVPFSVAYTLATSRDMEMDWHASYSSAFASGLDTNEDDLIVGVFWIRGRRTAESEAFAADAPPEWTMTIQTPTDDWVSTGDLEPSGRHEAGEEWERIMFTGRVMNDEPQSSNMSLRIFMGNGIQEIDIGGIVAWVFPSTPDNERAAMRIHF